MACYNAPRFCCHGTVTHFVVSCDTTEAGTVTHFVVSCDTTEAGTVTQFVMSCDTTEAGTVTNLWFPVTQLRLVL